MIHFEIQEKLFQKKKKKFFKVVQIKLPNTLAILYP